MDPREKPGFSDFVSETRDMLESLERDLVKIGEGNREKELLNSLFRSVHTIKGTAGMYDFSKIADFVHFLEETLDKVRSGSLEPSTDLIQIILQCKDHLFLRLDTFETGEFESEEILKEGENLIFSLSKHSPNSFHSDQKTSDKNSNTMESKTWKLHISCGSNLFVNGLDPYPFLRYLSEKGELSEIKLDEEKIPKFSDLEAASCFFDIEAVYRSELTKEEIVESFEFASADMSIQLESASSPSSIIYSDQNESTSKNVFQGKSDTGTKKKTSASRSIRVDADKLDLVVDQVGEVVVISSALQQIALGLKDEFLEELTHRMSRLLEEIRSNSLKLRMVPVQTLFSRYSRVVFELGKQTGKSVRLEIKGGETELDKNLIDNLVDPLTHMVRNSIDHGIESSQEERINLGKPSEALIVLAASHKAGEIFIEISDDGKGIDPQAVLERAKEKGLYKEGDAINEDQIYSLLFEPGFSTAASVTELSGRGVGLDVVKKNVESLRGRIEISSGKGKGTTFKIILPLTLANIDGFLLRIGKNKYAIPLDMVKECMEFHPQEFLVGEQNYIKVRDKIMPYVDMNDWFGEPIGTEGRRNLVIVNSGNLQAGLIVNELLGRIHSVIKPLGGLFEDTQGVSGFALMGDGSVAMIIDTTTLLSRVRINNEKTLNNELNLQITSLSEASK
ncbi:chemotaxis protein CheA [Leptospira andrefontaineae]|uniref:Chemotaxis protein CheA n=1 Tax=Leptospira andrefontaineae TaxID=2484976 RepID=A0A4R9HAD8_9LEPT|nr:chemotaxis protein CheA [Leptospira andrefontaineae]TGK43490.1 chemotaxis protein CheA [Leptospira andrefontaineae]